MKRTNYFKSQKIKATELDPTDPDDLKAIADEIIKSNFNFAVPENSSGNSAEAEESTTVQAVPKKPDVSNNSGVSCNSSASRNPSASRNSNAPNEINIVADLINNNLVQGLIMSEILGCPKGKRQRGNSIWNSRF